MTVDKQALKDDLETLRLNAAQCIQLGQQIDGVVKELEDTFIKQAEDVRAKIPDEQEQLRTEHTNTISTRLPRIERLKIKLSRKLTAGPAVQRPLVL